MEAFKFIENFLEAVKEEKPQGTGKNWTDCMYRVIGYIGRDYVVNHKSSYREINQLDFCFFPKSTRKNWHPPAVIIEHENDYKIEETKRDFWKCCLYAAPLRVIIGYAKNEEEALDQGKILTEFFNDWKLPRIPDGEVLLIYGWYYKEMPEKREWHRWLLPAEGDWEYRKI